MGKEEKTIQFRVKLEAVRLFEKFNLPASQDARDLGVDAGRLRVWCEDLITI